MKLKKSLLLLSVATTVALSGCTFSFSSADLIHPPKTVGNEAEIQQLIDKSAGDGYMLKYPQSGEYRSAIIMEDLNNDNADEAIAFYRTQGDNPVTHMLVMRDIGKKWEICCDYKTQHSEIDCVQFADYDYDGNKELFTGFVTYTTNVNELTVFDYNTETKEIQQAELSEFYTAFTTGDYDRDGACEAMLLTLPTAETNPEATLIDYDSNHLYTLASCSLDPNVTKFDSVTSGMIDEKNTGVAVDGLLTDSYNSQLIFYNSEKRQLINSYTKSERSTEKTHIIKTQDVDADGFLEIPCLSSCPVPKNAQDSVPAPLITWNSFNTSDYQFETDKSCLTDFDLKYSFFLPINFDGEITALLSKDEKTMSIYQLQDGKKGDLLVVFKVFESSTSADDLEGYTTIKSYNNYIYTYKIAEGELPLYIDADTITNNFVLNDTVNQNVQ